MVTSILFTPSWHSLIDKSRSTVYIPPPIGCSSDIDGQTNLLPDIRPSTASHTASTAEESLSAKNIQEDTISVAINSEEHTTSSQDSDRLESQSPPVPDNTDHSVHQDTEQPRPEHPNDYRPQ